MAHHEDLLICDLAEYYNIYDYKKMPVLLIATLASGLRAGSRCITAISGDKTSAELQLMALQTDYLAMLLWSKTKDAATGANKPESIFEKITGRAKKNDVEAFSSAEEFENARAKIIGN